MAQAVFFGSETGLVCVDTTLPMNPTPPTPSTQIIVPMGYGYENKRLETHM